MRNTLVKLLLGVVPVVLLAGAVGAQVKKGKTRPLETEQLMKGLIKPQSEAIKRGLEAATITDEGWSTLAISAALMNEASYTLMDDGRCPDDKWGDATTKSLRQGSADLIKAIAAKDQAAAKTAAATMNGSCKACHSVHKKKKQ